MPLTSIVFFFFTYYGGQWVPTTVWLLIFLFCVQLKKQKFIQVWNNLRVS